VCFAGDVLSIDVLLFFVKLVDTDDFWAQEARVVRARIATPNAAFIVVCFKYTDINFVQFEFSEESHL
jgi:hypothetical protein